MDGIQVTGRLVKTQNWLWDTNDRKLLRAMIDPFWKGNEAYCRGVFRWSEMINLFLKQLFHLGNMQNLFDMLSQNIKSYGFELYNFMWENETSVLYLRLHTHYLIVIWSSIHITLVFKSKFWTILYNFISNLYICR